MRMVSDFQRYRRLLSYAKPYRGRLIAGMLMLALVSLIEPVITIAFSRILDRAFVAEKSIDAVSQGATSAVGVASQSVLAQSTLFAWLSSALDALPILWFPFLLVAIFALRGAANFLGDLALHWVSSRVVFDLRQITFAHLLRL